MQGGIAQVIALTVYGNAVISGTSGVDAASFYPSNSTFVFCEYVRFVDARPKDGGRDETPWASDPTAWFARLKRDGVYALRLNYVPSGGKDVGGTHVPDRTLVGFVGGGGRWLIEAVGPRGSDFWEARWEVGDRNRADRKIWHVTYGRIASDQATRAKEPADLNGLKTRLDRTLTDIGRFAESQKLDNFAKAFFAGRARLASDDPIKDVYHTDIAPTGFLPLDAAQLLGAAQAAWVFGGMGSWNDVGLSGADASLYNQLSEDLFQLLNRSIIDSANSSIQAPIRPSRKAWWEFWK